MPNIDDLWLDDVSEGISDDLFDETDEETARRKAKRGVDKSTDEVSIEDIMKEIQQNYSSKDKPELGLGKEVKKRNWYRDLPSAAEKDFLYGDAPEKLKDEEKSKEPDSLEGEDLFSGFHINPSRAEAEDYSASDELFNSMGGEEDSFRKRTEEAKKKHPVVGKEERGLAKEKVEVKPVGKKGISVEKTKAIGKEKPLSDLPDSLEFKGDKKSVKPADMSKLPSTKVPTKVPYGESELFKDTKGVQEEDLPFDIAGLLAGGAPSLAKGLLKSGAKSAAEAATKPGLKTLGKVLGKDVGESAAPAIRQGMDKIVSPARKLDLGKLSGAMKMRDYESTSGAAAKLRELINAGIPMNEARRLVLEFFPNLK